ncbi:MAG: endonuclease/exonuclease/phosphatase family protein [Candidatus Limivicinus sp.]|jgi:endonuclease/exonuclease/phosphatase family metal-dependent hydrolase
MKTFLKILLWIILIIIIAFAGLITWLSIEEYKPAPVEDIEISACPDSINPKAGEGINILSWNIGYAGLGEGSDFFMDGGKDSQSADEATVNKYLDGIEDTIDGVSPDITMLQEVDLDSKRTYGINEAERLSDGNSVHALNYSCPFVPIPMPPMGKINSGVFTTTAYEIKGAQRVALPCPFSWPVSTANLKRCLLVSYLPVEGSDSQLVIVNLHLEAYDDGEGKLAQTRMLREFIAGEYEKGNYVIAGGDFNQTFPGSMEDYPIIQDDYWVPGVLDDSFLPEGWEFAYSLEEPTCRLLNHPYDSENEENNQFYVLDGFIISPNVELNSVENINVHFKNSDHNPVLINVTLK